MSKKIVMLIVLALFSLKILADIGENQDNLIKFLAEQAIEYRINDDGLYFVFNGLQIKVPSTLFVVEQSSVIEIDLLDSCAYTIFSRAPSMMGSLANFGSSGKKIGQKLLTKEPMPMNNALLKFAQQLKAMLDRDIDMDLDTRLLLGEIHRQSSDNDKYVFFMAHVLRRPNIREEIRSNLERIATAFGSQKGAIQTAYFAWTTQLNAHLN